MIRARTRARGLALQFLFQVDFQGDAYLEDLDGFLDDSLAEDPAPGDTIMDVKQYARSLVRGVIDERETIDGLLERAASNWQLDRMAVVDRNALRIGCYEMIFVDDVPTKVALNEAIELAKRYSTEASGAFVNGILDRIRKDQGLRT